MTSELSVASLFFPFIKLRLTTYGSKPYSHSPRSCPFPAITHAWRRRHPTFTRLTSRWHTPYLLQQHFNRWRRERALDFIPLQPQTSTLVCETLEPQGTWDVFIASLSQVFTRLWLNALLTDTLPTLFSSHHLCWAWARSALTAGFLYHIRPYIFLIT